MTTSIKRNLVNMLGWKTKRKLVVFESDDWGMIRMSSSLAYSRLLEKGYPVNKSPYDQNDSLETDEDLNKLMDVLSSVDDKNGNPALLTLNMIMCNPDFEKIKSSDFLQYFYEPFTMTLNRSGSGKKILDAYSKGISEKLFHPQFHGREHINVNRWLTGLQNNESRFQDAFNENMYTVVTRQSESGRFACLDTYGVTGEKLSIEIKNSIKEGLDLFEKIWGYRSKSFIAPCFTWPSELEEVLYNNGIKYIQGTHVQRIPKNNSDLSVKRKYHFLGQKNKYNQLYLVRNVFFEPTELIEDPIENAMEQIDNAFRWNKPAIVCSHRLNYIGSINQENRTQNLKLLEKLLNKIINKYPDVEFISSSDLGDIISEK